MPPRGAKSAKRERQDRTHQGLRTEAGPEHEARETDCRGNGEQAAPSVGGDEDEPLEEEQRGRPQENGKPLDERHEERQPEDEQPEDHEQENRREKEVTPRTWRGARTNGEGPAMPGPPKRC